MGLFEVCIWKKKRIWVCGKEQKEEKMKGWEKWKRDFKREMSEMGVEVIEED